MDPRLNPHNSSLTDEQIENMTLEEVLAFVQKEKEAHATREKAIVDVWMKSTCLNAEFNTRHIKFVQFGKKDK